MELAEKGKGKTMPAGSVNLEQFHDRRSPFLPLLMPKILRGGRSSDLTVSHALFAVQQKDNEFRRSMKAPLPRFVIKCRMPAGGIYPVPLTTVRAPQHEIGKRAAEILIRNIESTTLLPTERVVFETEFVIRESSRVLKD